jgi:hypothetical protein
MHCYSCSVFTVCYIHVECYFAREIYFVLLNYYYYYLLLNTVFPPLLTFTLTPSDNVLYVAYTPKFPLGDSDCLLIRIVSSPYIPDDRQNTVS